MACLKQDYLPESLAPLLQQNNIDGCIAVQARESVEETRWLLALAEQHSDIKAVVGWVDICSPDLLDQLQQFSANNKLKGFRHVLQGECNDFMLQPSFIKGLKILAEHGYSYDILVHAGQLSTVCQLVEQLPCMRLVLDHIGKPNIAGDEHLVWMQQISKLASYSHVYCKVSGMVTEADLNHWQPQQIDPYLAHVTQCFGQNRLMFGSDWPVCLLAADYQQVINLVEQYFEQISEEASCSVMGNTAIEFYRLIQNDNKKRE
jgi:L-fuconolactonase